ncbi:hypothetical protein POSPLADRAFT_1179402 [Postia placenta MAD-698-R-SB12]|uniref:NAD(P)-binding domain-containing protein n=1 Tax=Postia placenta MAD-698-R-SB12 TaxID=670580 RepID=A0A1X6NAI5_9APHY|nr:hypothetical protein POSPLADRAFT_1179402 [Postia placenta MAD-698-R-SB12]OSX65658.1 hypothetical protein POSPLADRAFT_1179402 [Postia placenta MAD-698-R-SB12]
MNVFAIGASKNIGYYASVRLLEKGATVTFLLRSPSVFDEDTTIQKYVTTGKAHLVKGDALVVDDVRRAWQTAQAAGVDRGVDLVIFTVGGTPNFSLVHGAVISPPNLVTQATLNLLSTIPAHASTRVIAVSSNGLSRASHATLPLALKPLYGYLLRRPHADKLGVERVVAHCAGWQWTDEDPDKEILSEGWQDREGLLKAGELEHVVVVRPALLTDGPCRGDSVPDAPYRVSEGNLKGSYRVSRSDVAHFMVNGLLPHWDEWEGKCVGIAY